MMCAEPKSEQWMNMKEAAILLGVKPNLLSRLGRAGKIKTRATIKDQRQRLVDVVELRELFKDS